MRKIIRQCRILIRNRKGKALLVALGHSDRDVELVVSDVADRCAIIDLCGYGGSEDREGEDEKAEVHLCSRGLFRR
jgi:hypothetical protein